MGTPAFYARSGTDVDDLCADRLEHFPVLRLYRPEVLEAAGFEIVPTFRTPHVTLAFYGDLDVLGRPASTSTWPGPTTDKDELCDGAIERLGHRGDRSGALLIDNRADLIDAWRRVGGAAYWFRADTDFARDLPTLAHLSPSAGSGAQCEQPARATWQEH